MSSLNAINAILLDIEGTTTPVNFVFGVLFPYARDRVLPFLAAHGSEPMVQADLARLRQDYECEPPTAELPSWCGTEPSAAVPFIHYLMERDRKSTGLKALQGKVWDQGYREGTLKSQLFADVKPALIRWHQAGKQLFIYSSGSIQAQKLLFGHTDDGDLTPFIRGYFDTTTGPKQAPASYAQIAMQINIAPMQILFISDVVAELQAAAAAGMQTRLSQRPGNAPQPAGQFAVITSFAALA